MVIQMMYFSDEGVQLICRYSRTGCNGRGFYSVEAGYGKIPDNENITINKDNARLFTKFIS